jgi:endo-1,4-beta-xylanase
MKDYSRRQFLTTALAATAIPVVNFQSSQSPGLQSPLSLQPVHLSRSAGRKGILYGTLLTTKRLLIPEAQWQTNAYCRLVEDQAAIVTNATMHFDLVEPAEGHFDFTTPDRLTSFAMANNFRMRGHALCWYQHFPKWLGELDRNAAIAAMENHIHTVVSRYAGRIHSWDVVNEALNPDDKAPGGLRISGFTKAMGWDWMNYAYRAAREADPHALLSYNEYRIEVTHYGDSDQRRIDLLNLLDNFRRNDVPIDAVGIQSHMDYRAWKFFDARAYADFLREVASRDVKIFLTEFDVIDVGTPTEPAERDPIIAALYEEYLSVALENPAVCAVVNWGLDDADSWQNAAAVTTPSYRRADGTPGRGLPFDDDFQPKLDAHAMVRVFERIPER